MRRDEAPLVFWKGLRRYVSGIIFYGCLKQLMVGFEKSPAVRSAP